MVIQRQTHKLKNISENKLNFESRSCEDSALQMQAILQIGRYPRAIRNCRPYGVVLVQKSAKTCNFFDLSQKTGIEDFFSLLNILEVVNRETAIVLYRKKHCHVW